MTAAGFSAEETLMPGSRRVRTMRMGRRKGKRRRSRDESRRRFEEAADLYLEDCFETQRPVSVKEFATKYLEATRPYLSRLAPQFVGATMLKHFRSRQLARAQELLRTAPEKATILQIAMASGFGSPWTFSVHFKKAYGMTPGRYRTEMRRKRRK